MATLSQNACLLFREVVAEDDDFHTWAVPPMRQNKSEISYYVANSAELCANLDSALKTASKPFPTSYATQVQTAQLHLGALYETTDAFYRKHRGSLRESRTNWLPSTALKTIATFVATLQSFDTTRPDKERDATIFQVFRVWNFPFLRCISEEVEK